MTKQHITTEQFTAAIEAAVAERGGDFVYPLDQEGWSADNAGNRCVYVRTDVNAPACLIGDALFRCGVTLDQLRTQEGRSASRVMETLTDLPGRVGMTADWAQSRQDIARPWSDALETYHRWMND